LPFHAVVGRRSWKLISVSTRPTTRQCSGSPPPAGTMVAEVMVVFGIAAPVSAAHWAAVSA